MSEDSAKNPSEMNAFAAYRSVAAGGATGSVFIALIGLAKFTQVSDSGMWAMAVMVLAPALMAIGVSYFVSVSARAGISGSAVRVD